MNPFLYKTILQLFVVFSCSTFNIFAQDSLLIGRKYFEDQIYAGFTYNILDNKPADFQQKGISSGFHVGFIKDIPLNKMGTFAFGIGAGYSYNKYATNYRIQQEVPGFILIDDNYDTNKFSLHAIEIPVEIRVFRSSTPTLSKFFRIYIGGKISYIFYSRSTFKSTDLSFKVNPLPYIDKWQYGPNISIGWGPWNLYTYYGITGLFNKAPQTGTLNPNKLNSIKIGLQFYIF